MRFRRRIYNRGGSHETTIPKPLLFALDPEKRHDAIFSYDPATKRWTIEFAERDAEPHRRKGKRQEEQAESAGGEN